MGLLEDPGASVARGTDHSLTACLGVPIPHSLSYALGPPGLKFCSR